MANNIVFKTSTNKTIDNLFVWDKSNNTIIPNTDINNTPSGIPIAPGTVYFTSDGHIIYDIATNTRLWMSKKAYSAIYAEDIADTEDIKDLLNTKVSKITSTNNAIARYDGITGDLKNSASTTIDDNGKVTIGGDLEVNGNVYFNNETIVENLTTGSLSVSGNSNFINDAQFNNITAGTWNGSTIDITHGGTGNTSFTTNRLIYASTSNTLGSASGLYTNGTNLAINKTSFTDTSKIKFEVKGTTLFLTNESCSSTLKSSPVIISSNYTSAGGAVGLELWRGTNVSWQIINDSGSLIFRNNWINNAYSSTYNSTPSLTIGYQEGDVTISGELLVNGTGENNYYGNVIIGQSTDIFNRKNIVKNSYGSISLTAGTSGTYPKRGLTIEDINSNNNTISWLIYYTNADSNNTGQVGIPKWASIGSTTAPVYFDTSGQPAQITSIPWTLLSNIPEASASQSGIVNTTTQTFAGTKTLTINYSSTYDVSAASPSVNTNYSNAPNRIIDTPIPKYFWHDIFSFCRLGVPDCYLCVNNNDTWEWVEQTEDNNEGITTKIKKLFAHKTANQTILDGTAKGVRFIWHDTVNNSSQLAYSGARWLVLGVCGSVGKIPNYTVKFEHSSDNGVTWTSLLDAPADNTTANILRWFYLSGSYGGSRYVRLTVEKDDNSTNFNQPLPFSTIKLLTGRLGSQGYGPEIEYPYSWDENKDITMQNVTTKNIVPSLNKGYNLGSNNTMWNYIYGTYLNCENGTFSNATDSNHSSYTSASVYTAGGLSVKKRLSAKEIQIDNNSTTKKALLQYDETTETLSFNIM